MKGQNLSAVFYSKWVNTPTLGSLFPEKFLAMLKLPDFELDRSAELKDQKRELFGWQSFICSTLQIAASVQAEGAVLITSSEVNIS